MKPDEEQEEMLVTYTLMQEKTPLTKFEEDLGISSEYDRRIYDSPSARREFHESQFKGKKTTISSDGKVVHQSHKAAKNKYGKKHASLHQGEADHIDPLKNIHERVENNPLACLFLSDSDLQEVGNRRTNFQELSKGENTSKGAKSELQRGIETCDVKRVAKGISVQVETDVLLTNKAIQNAGKIFAKGAANALEASVIPLVIKGTQDLCHVANGDMTLKEATEDVGKLGGTILASGGTERLATWALGKALEDSENKVIKEFAKANQIGTILVIGSIVAKAAGKYLDGEIDGSGFISEIGQDGLSMISGMLASKATVSLLGGATGLVAVATPVLAAMIASAACSEIYSKAKKVLQEQRDNLEIQHIADTASAEIARQQIELKRLMGESHAKWLDDMHTAFEKIAFGLTNGNVLQTNDGLCQIMSLYHVDASLYQSGDDVLDDLISFRNGTQDFHLLHS